MLITTSTNPGTVDPSLQGFPPPPGTAPAPSTSPLASGNGECQFPASQAARSLPTTGRGLPAEIHPAGANLARAQAPVVAQVTSPAVDVRGGDARPGGLPKNVCIR